MTTWLFGTHLGATVADKAGSMRPVAVHQLLRLTAEEGTGRAAFVARVRRIAALGGGRDHGVVAPEAQSDDAVRLMTIHGSKGLEFGAVHLPPDRATPMPVGARSRPLRPMPSPEAAVPLL